MSDDPYVGRRDVYRLVTALDRLRREHGDFDHVRLVETFLRWSATADVHELAAMQAHLAELIHDAGAPGPTTEDPR